MVSIISFQDHSRVGRLYADALNKVGVEAKSLSISSHPYGYSHRTPVVQPETMLKECAKSDVIIVMHSRTDLLKYVQGRPYFVMHGGTPYRQHSTELAEAFKDAQGAIIQTPDLLRLASNKKERLIMCPIDTNIEPIPFAHVKHKFVHHPSNRINKGTEQIRKMLDEMRVGDYYINESLLPFADNLKRMGKGACYVELFKPMQRGKVYGTFGTTALEAALIGRPVLTQCANYQDYLAEYNMDAFEISNDEAEFKESLRDINQMNLDSLNHWGNTCRQLVLERHSLEVIGNKLKEFVL